MNRHSRLLNRSVNVGQIAKAGTGFAVRALANRTVINLYDEIGFFGVTAKDFKAALDSITTSEILLNINSPGGDVFDGLAIYSDLLNHPANVTVSIRGIAASAASLIAMAGNRIEIADSGFIMIHNAWSVAVGDANAIAELSKTLAKIDTQLARAYSAKTDIPVAEIRDMMAAETWMDSGDALDAGFVDAIETAPEDANTSASYDLTSFKNVPRALVGPKRSIAEVAPAKAGFSSRVLAELDSAISTLRRK